MPKLLIDCDPGHDDAVAILFAARHLDVVGITTVHGNAGVEATTRNALGVLTLAGLDIPLAKGCAEPLVGAPVHAAHIHGESGLDGAELPEPDRAPVAAHGVDFLIEKARGHAGELVVAAIGPLTNLAVALKREPRLKRWVRAFTIMGGSTTSGNVTPVAEFNIRSDPEAAAAVFESGVPIHLVGLNVTRTVGFGVADIEALRGRGGRTARTVADLLQFYLGRQRIRSLDLAPMHDACAMLPYIASELVTYTHVRVDIELASPLTRGMTVCDFRPRPVGVDADPSRPAPNAHVAIAADGRAIVDRIVEALVTYP